VRERRLELGHRAEPCLSADLGGRRTSNIPSKERGKQSPLALEVDVDAVPTLAGGPGDRCFAALSGTDASTGSLPLSSSAR
jgi:hypothetical protein